MPTNRPLGWVKDPAKSADEKPDVGAGPLLSAAPIPPEASQENHVILLNQGPYNSCVANNVAQVIRARHSKLGVKNPKLPSRWWAYHLSLATHPDPSGQLRDEGTYIRACMGAMRKFGFVAEEDWSYDEKYEGRPKWACQPPVNVFWKAADRRSPLAYYRITETGSSRVAAVKRAIAAGFCVVWGTLVTEAFCNGDFGEAYVGLPQAGDPIAGGHAMTIAKYNRSGFSGPQTWGKTWGDQGWYHFKPEVIAWDQSSDFWIAENAPGL